MTNRQIMSIASK